MFIRNYGLFWERDNVFWGKQRNSGRLLGKRTKTEKTKIVDFREQVGFYALYDNNFNLVYFGQVGKGEHKILLQRVRDHLTDHLSGRWTHFSWFGIKGVNDENKNRYGFYELKEEASNINGKRGNFLDQVEAVVIAVSEPPNNRQGGSFKDAKKYMQHRDTKKLGASTEDMLREIYNRPTTQQNNN